MKFTEEIETQGHVIRAYEAGAVTIGERSFRDSLIVTRERLDTGWRPQEIGDLRQEDVATILAFEPEIVILGTGARQVFPDASLLVPLIGNGIGLEVMDTAAACRTYNILMSEGRRVAAALMMI